MNFAQTIKKKINLLVRSFSANVDRFEYPFISDFYYYLKAQFFCSEIEVKRNDFEFQIMLPEDEYSALLREQKVYEPGLTDPLIDTLERADEDEVFWNVGAYCGYFSVFQCSCQ